MSEDDLIVYCRALQRENELLRKERDRLKFLYDRYCNDCDTLLKISQKIIKAQYDSADEIKKFLVEHGFEWCPLESKGANK